MKDQPFYIKGAYFLLFIGLIVAALMAGRPLLVPLVAAMLFAFLMLPITQKVESWNMPTWLASFAGVISLLLIGIGLCFFLSWQIMSFAEDMPAMQQAIDEKTKAVNKYIVSHYGISRREQSQWVQQKMDQAMNEGAGSLMKVFSTTGGVIATLVLIPIFMFFMLLYRQKFKLYLEMANPSQHDQLVEIFRKISGISQKYIRGMFFEIAILTVLSSIGFMLLGLKYSILLALIVAVLNIVPYVGVLVGSLVPVAIALVTKDSGMYALGALGVCIFVQFLDNNFIAPKVVGSSVNLNPFASIIVLLVGALVWELPGMILSMPIAGMFKVVCDNVPPLKSLGFMMGEDETLKHPFKLSVRKRKKAVAE